MVCLKTTFEIPDPLYRRLKVAAARQGRSVRALINDAVISFLRRPEAGTNAEPGWRKGFGRLRRIRAETRRIETVIHDEFSAVNPEDWK